MIKYNCNNMVQYAKKQWATFEEVPFNEVDSLIFTWLCYLHFPKESQLLESPKGILLREIFMAEYFDDMFVSVWNPEDTMALLTACVASPRYRDVRLLHYREEKDVEVSKQFGAITFQISGECYYVCFRGTDWSVAGWEENFKLALTEPVPSQRLAVEYLNDMAECLPGKFYVGGHSKGGHLAVFAAAYAAKEVQDRIEIIYNHDGPGFLKGDMENEGFAIIRDRIYKTMPKFSVFGMLFEQEAEGVIIKSSEFGIMQHNSLSWLVEENHLVQEKTFSSSSIYLGKKVNEWLNGIDDSKRAKFIDILFNLLDTTGVDDFGEMGKHLYKNAKIVMQSMKNMDPEMHDFMMETIHPLFFKENKDEVQGETELNIKNEV